MEKSASEALSKISDTGVVGAFCVLIIIVLVWTARQWQRTQKALDAEKDGRLQDAKEYGKSGEALRATMTALEGTVKTATEIIRERIRS